MQVLWTNKRFLKTCGCLKIYLSFGMAQLQEAVPLFCLVILKKPKLKCCLILIVLSWVPLVTGEGAGYQSPDNTRQEDMIGFTVYLKKYYSCLWWLFWNELSQLAKSFEQYILTFTNIQTMNKNMDLTWESSCSFMVHHTKFVYSNYKPLTIHSVNLFYFKVDVNWNFVCFVYILEEYVLCVYLFVSRF